MIPDNFTKYVLESVFCLKFYHKIVNGLFNDIYYIFRIVDPLHLSLSVNQHICLYVCNKVLFKRFIDFSILYISHKVRVFIWIDLLILRTSIYWLLLQNGSDFFISYDTTCKATRWKSSAYYEWNVHLQTDIII